MKIKLKNLFIILILGVIGLSFNINVLADENVTVDYIDGENGADFLTIGEENEPNNEVLDSTIIDVRENATLSNDIAGSPILIGNTVNHDKNVDGLSFLLANDIEFNGTSEYLLSLGNSVRINGAINKDLFLAGASIKFDESTIAKRDALIMGSSVVVKGSFARDILIFGETVSLKNATINGDIKIYATNIEIDENTVIAGKLEYNENADINIISSNIGQIEKMESIIQGENFKELLQTKLFGLIRLIALFALLTIIVPKVFDKFNKYSRSLQLQDTFIIFCYGAGMLFLIPVISILLMISTIGLSIGVILIALYLIAIYGSHILSGYILGNIIWDKIVKKEKNNLLVGVLGIIVIFIFRLIPIIGDYITIISIVMGLGILSKNLRQN